MIDWDDLQKWITKHNYNLVKTSDHYMLYIGDYTVYLNPHNFRDGVPPSKLNEIAKCLGITRKELVDQINAC